MPAIAHLTTAIRLAGGTPVSSRGGGRPGVPFMSGTLGPDARISVEVAWGADPNGNPDLWSWTDITEDVRHAQKISMKVGRADEASNTQPASCTFQLDNRAGAYSQGPQSSNYPNVKRNVPIRVRVDPNGTGPVVLWQGYGTSFTPGWDTSTRNAIVKVVANGTLRRLIQKTSPLVSPYRRGVLQNSNVVAYWPCEDAKGSTSLAAGLATHGPMTVTGSPKLYSNTDFVGSDSIPLIEASIWVGSVPAYTNTGNHQVQMLISWPKAGTIADLTTVVSIYTSGTVARVDLVYGSSFGGSLQLNAYDAAGATLLSTGFGFAEDGKQDLVTVAMEASGSDVILRKIVMNQGAFLGSLISYTITGQTISAVNTVVVNPGGGLGDTAIGHVIVKNTAASAFSERFQLNGNQGEDPLNRIRRLCAENNIPVTVITSGETVTPVQGFYITAAYAALIQSQNTLMGIQKVDTLVNLLRQCEAADQGILYDGVGPGLVYVSRLARENHAAALTVSAAALSGDFAPVDDDQGNLNQVTVTRYQGSSDSYEDTTGPLGTGEIGVYDTTTEINAARDDYLKLYASWLVHRGTVEGYRYPKIRLDLAHNPELAAAWIAAADDLSSRIDVTGLDTTLAQHPAGVLSSMIEGYQHTIDQIRWDVTLNTTSFSGVWQIGTLAADTGDTSATILRLDTDGSTLTTTAPAGSTSLTVATPSGPVWTTTADDCPFDVDIGGWQVTVTAVSGGSSPQTFTVNPTSHLLPAGAAVKLWRPYVLGL